LTILPTTTPTGLYPGGPAQALEYTINNSAAFDQAVTTVTIAITGVTGGCAAGNFTLVQPTQSPGVILAGATFSSTPAGSGASIKLDETNVNQDACKGAVVSLSYTGV
jgi:hypothetical protein